MGDARDDKEPVEAIKEPVKQEPLSGEAAKEPVKKEPLSREVIPKRPKKDQPPTEPASPPAKPSLEE